MMVMLSDNYVARDRSKGLEPLENTGIHVMFFVQPVVAEAGRPWKTTLVFIDQYNNRHKVKNCVFRGLEPPPRTSTAAG